MNILYKRIVTMCMICISSLLAWVYCIIEFKDKPAVIVGMSVLFVVSMYALLNAYIDIKNKKEEKLESMINSAVNDTLSKLNNDEKTIELERILKASYVQSRKTNTILTNSNQINADNLQSLMELLTSQNDTNRESLNSSLNKTAKIIAKYGKNDSEKI